MMSQLIFPKCVLDDIKMFVSEYYQTPLPHSLLIAQAFCLEFNEYGNDFGVSAITDAVEKVRTHQA